MRRSAGLVLRANVYVVRAGLDRRDSPRIIGRYALYEEIASGGMASVHFARLVDPRGASRTFAVKRAHPHLARESDFALMFLDEARLAAHIRHPNVVPTIDVLTVPPELLLVMEYVHGESLWKLVRAAKQKNERVPAPIAGAIVVDALHGLHAAHEASDENGKPLGVVHRDVSPHNILVGVDGVARLVDFGIAKAVGRLHSTRDSSVKGKFAYMAPEQVRGDPLTRVADTYAAGIVLWELLTGERLFVGRTEAETIHKCLVGRVQAPSRFAPELGPRIDEILKKALSRDPAHRYATAQEMALDVEASLPAAARADVGAWVQRIAAESLGERERAIVQIERSSPSGAPGTRQRRAIVSAIAIAIAGVGALGSATLLARRRGPEEPARGVANAAPSVAVTTAATQSVAPSADTAAAPASSVVAPASADSTRPAATRPRSSSPSPSPARPLTRAGVPSRSGRPKPATCDPPYSIDAEGRQIFKPECM
jgi:serine/threonine-protein kinase